MKRREFIGLAGGAALAWTFAAGAQTQPVRIGFLYARYEGSPTFKAQLAEIAEGDRISLTPA